jgi:hypothetical protein
MCRFFFLMSTRPLPVRSKELPHVDSDGGGERGAAIDTLVGIAKLNGLDAGAYLRHIIAFIAEHPVNRVDELSRWIVADLLQADAARIQRAAFDCSISTRCRERSWLDGYVAPKVSKVAFQHPSRCPLIWTSRLAVLYPPL